MVDAASRKGIGLPSACLPVWLFLRRTVCADACPYIHAGTHMPLTLGCTGRRQDVLMDPNLLRFEQQFQVHALMLRCVLTCMYAHVLRSWVLCSSGIYIHVCIDLPNDPLACDSVLKTFSISRKEHSVFMRALQRFCMVRDEDNQKAPKTTLQSWW